MFDDKQFLSVNAVVAKQFPDFPLNNGGLKSKYLIIDDTSSCELSGFDLAKKGVVLTPGDVFQFRCKVNVWNDKKSLNFISKAGIQQASICESLDLLWKAKKEEFSAKESAAAVQVSSLNDIFDMSVPTRSPIVGCFAVVKDFYDAKFTKTDKPMRSFVLAAHDSKLDIKATGFGEWTHDSFQPGDVLKLVYASVNDFNGERNITINVASKMEGDTENGDFNEWYSANHHAFRKSNEELTVRDAITYSIENQAPFASLKNVFVVNFKDFKRTDSMNSWKRELIVGDASTETHVSIQIGSEFSSAVFKEGDIVKINTVKVYMSKADGSAPRNQFIAISLPIIAKDEDLSAAFEVRKTKLKADSEKVTKFGLKIKKVAEIKTFSAGCRVFMDDATLEKANEDKFLLSGPNDDSKINVNIIGKVKNFEKVNVSFHNALVLENESLEINVSDMKVEWY